MYFKSSDTPDRETIVWHASQRSVLRGVGVGAHGEYRDGAWHRLLNNVNSLRRTKYHFQPSLLAESRQVRSEAAGFLYQQALIFDSHKTLLAFLRPLSVETTSQLTDITVLDSFNAEGKERFGASLHLQGATGLRNLRYSPKVCGLTRELSMSDEVYAWTLAHRLFLARGPFIRAFVARAGVPRLLEVIKLDHSDLAVRQGRLRRLCWTDKHKRRIREAVYERIVLLMGQR